MTDEAEDEAEDEVTPQSVGPEAANTLVTFLARVVLEGGSVVGEASLSPRQLQLAKSTGRFLQTQLGHSFVYVPGPKVAPRSDDDNELSDEPHHSDRDPLESHASRLAEGLKHLRLSKAGALGLSEEAAVAVSREACRACIEALATVRRVSNNVDLVALVVARVFREFVDESYRLNEPNPAVVSGFLRTADAIASRVSIGSGDAPDDSDDEAVFQVVPMSPGGVA